MTDDLIARARTADRIEELERELAAEKEAHKACEFMMRTNASMAADLAVKLAAEKALADQGREVVQHWVEHSHHPCQLSDEFLAAYRKARGL